MLRAVRDPARETHMSDGTIAALRSTWSYEVEDIGWVPLEYLQVNHAAVLAAMKQRDPETGEPLTTITGIRWVETRTLVIK
jgi:hypothetical protein